MMLTGHCHCRRNRFRVDGEPSDASFCHCTICRQLTGSAFAAWYEVASTDMRWLSRPKSRSTYQVTERLEIDFCRNCGGTLMARHSSWPDCCYVPLGALVDDALIAPGYHQFTGSKASWYAIHDELPQFEAWPDGE